MQNSLKKEQDTFKHGMRINIAHYLYITTPPRRTWLWGGVPKSAKNDVFFHFIVVARVCVCGRFARSSYLLYSAEYGTRARDTPHIVKNLCFNENVLYYLTMRYV